MLDPLLCDFPLPHFERFYPLGFPVDVLTNSACVLEAARQSWGQFEHTFDRRPMILRIGVIGTETGPMPGPPVYRGYRNLVSMISDSENYSICELANGFAYAWLTEAVVRHTAFFRYFFLEASANLLISSTYLAAVHAACVEFEGQGVLLAGDSGSGKSSLAYTCARAGWTYITDDASYLMRDGDSLEVIGNPFQMRLRDTASAVFPEFSGSDANLRPNGNSKIEVLTCTLNGVKISGRSNVQMVVFLNRNGANSPELVPFPKPEALKRWSQTICYGDADVRAAQHKAFLRLLDADVYELRYAEASTAVSYLEKFLSGEK